jgi:phosphonate transport system substrate-binding protein
VGALAPASGHAQLVLRIHPYKPSHELILAYTPLADYLSRQLGQRVSIRIAKDYQEHLHAVTQNTFDIAYVAPVSYVEMTSASGLKPLLARQAVHGSPTFRGKIIVRADSPIQSLADLKGKRLAFVDPLSTMGYIVPAAMLLEQGITLNQLGRMRFLNDHANVALSVLLGDDDAGAVKEDVFAEYRLRGLRAIATSPSISDHLFVASPGLPPATVQALRTALLGLAAAPGGKEVLQRMTPGLTALLPVSDSDYNGLRMLMARLRKAAVLP